MGDLLIIIGIVVLVGLVLLGILAVCCPGTYKKAPPNMAMIVYGDGNFLKEGRYRIVVGGGTRIHEDYENVAYLPLSILVSPIETRNALTSGRIPVNVDGLVQTKIEGTEEAISLAAEQLLEKTEENIKQIVQGIVVGHLQDVISKFTVEEIYQDRAGLTREVQEAAAEDLDKVGLRIISFTVSQISDQQGYLNLLGQARLAEAKRDARISEAKANQEAMEAETMAQVRIAEIQKNRDIQVAQFQASYIQAQVEAELVEEIRKTQIALFEIIRKKQELEIQSKTATDTEAYRLTTLARAEARGATELAEARAAKDGINLQYIALVESLRAKVEIARALAHLGENARIVQFGATSEGLLGQLFSQLLQLPEVVSVMSAKSEALSGKSLEGWLKQILTGLAQSSQTEGETKEDN